ncbi:hypothetical protein ACWEP4_42205 [Streptomyces sp. NPDC004227]
MQTVEVSGDNPVTILDRLWEGAYVRARWDGHTTAQKYLRIRTHTAVLALSGDGASTVRTARPRG